MRLKSNPEDFRVRELLEWEEAPAGRYVVHHLRKEKLSTPEALAMIVREGDVERSAIAYAGLKDRQAVTEQFLTIDGRTVDLDLPSLRLRPVGRSAVPITSKMSQGNAFRIVARNLSPSDATRLRRSLPSLQKTGLPNYFDDQRFGCLRHGQGFVMHNVLLGDFERALQQIVAEPSPVAISGDVKLKRTLQWMWGDWEACLRIARGPAYEPIFAHLCQRPNDFRGALECVPLRQRVIHAFAYQSFLWNRAVSRMLRGGVLSPQRLRIHTIAGDLLAWKYLAPEREEKLRTMSTPLFGMEGDTASPPFAAAMKEELRESGIKPSDFAANRVPGMIWKEEPRAALVLPFDLANVVIRPDDQFEGRVLAELAFSLPRGAYATMVVKRLFARSWYDHGPVRSGGGQDGRWNEDSDNGDD